MNILLVVGEDDIISAAFVTYFWTTDVGTGLGVDEVGFASDFFLPEEVFLGGGMGSCFAVADVAVLLDGVDVIINRSGLS